MLLYYYFFLNSINKDTEHVIILGSKGAGKTTLWNKLRNKITEKVEATDEEKIESFIIKFGEKARRISETKDLGGDDLLVPYYDEIINANGMFIYFLVDLTRLEETRLEIKARLTKISQIIKEKELSNCGCKILATNLGKYKSLGFEEKYGAPISYVKSVLKLKTIDNLSIKIDNYILPIELTDDSQIDIIKEEITNK